MVVCKTNTRRVVDESKWTEIAYKPKEVIPVPKVATDNQSYDLRDPNGRSFDYTPAGCKYLTNSRWSN
ncbi:UNVERIFIED_CONTAM: hypothetical protein Sradi_4604700 [Sesamum radiatum]|uniref:Uncharacterized protein n=1 Tax=Sesamum radiatum TaxID=300843 RepID=A0AAW2NBD1_SESRA